MVAMPKSDIYSPVTSIAICQLLDLVRSEKWWKGHTIHIVPQYPNHYIEQLVRYLYKNSAALSNFMRRTFTPHSSLLTPHFNQRFLKCQLFRKRNTSFFPPAVHLMTSNARRV